MSSQTSCQCVLNEQLCNLIFVCQKGNSRKPTKVEINRAQASLWLPSLVSYSSSNRYSQILYHCEVYHIYGLTVMLHFNLYASIPLVLLPKVRYISILPLLGSR